jgi:hypothetical protein
MLNHAPTRMLDRVRHALSLLDPEDAKRVLKEHGGATDVNNVHPSRLPDVLRETNAALDEPRRQKQAEFDKRLKESGPDGFEDATSTI